MTQTTELSDALKNLPIEPNVLSEYADKTDRLLTVGADGVIKGSRPGMLDYASEKIGAPGWVRVAKWVSNKAVYCILSVHATYGNRPGAMAWLAFKGAAEKQRAAIKTLARFEDATNCQQVRKVRMVMVSGGDCYLDVYYPYETANAITVINHLSGLSMLTLLAPFETDAQIPEGYSVKEFDLTE